MGVFSKILLLFLAIKVMTIPAVEADWINFSGAENAPNTAEIYINDDHVKVALEIYVRDMVIFDRLIPDEFFKDTHIKRLPLADRLERFSREDFQIQTDQGKKLQTTIKRASPRLRKPRPSPYAGKINPYTRQPIPGPPSDKRVLYVELVYPFLERPKSLTFIPPIDAKGTSKASIGFMTYHQGVPIMSFRYLSGPSTVILDWDDPWYSEFEEKALKRWQRGSVMSFLYVEPYEVRHEVLARVKDLEAWIDLDLRGDVYIEADENEPLKERVGAFFLERDKVLIDGKRLRPILDRTAFVKYALTGSTFLEQPERLPINTAMVGVIITYLTENLPQQITYEWDLWSDRIQKVPTNAIDPAGGLPSFVTPNDNKVVWTNFLKKYKVPTVSPVGVDASLITFKIPLASILCLLALVPLAFRFRKGRHSPRSLGLLLGLAVLLILGSVLLYPFLRVAIAKPARLAPKMKDKEAVVVLNSLLKNIYRSFDFREEGDVYDRLSRSVHGDLLADIYLQSRKSLAVSQAGGAQARVKEIIILEVDVKHLDDRPLGLLFHAAWAAMGTVGHWGHIHIRKNQYEANITVAPVAGAWKIIEMDLLEEKRIDPYGYQRPAK